MASGEYSSSSSTSGMGSSWHDLSKSDYAKVIFSDLYYNPHSSVGCRFQITDNVHEDPCDYVGLFKVGYDNLSECLVSKLLSQTECEEDGKLLRCTFKISELPVLEGGYYQFLYVTRDNEVCGASLPFAIGHTVPMTKDCLSDEDVVAYKTEDDFLVVRSNLADRNRQLESLLDKMQQTYMTLEDKLMKNFKDEVEKKLKLEDELKLIHSEMDKFSKKCKLIAVEHSIKYTSNEAVVEFLETKVAHLESKLADADYKIKKLEVMKSTLEEEKNKAICEKIRLQETVDELISTSELKSAETAEIKYMLERKNEDKIAEVYEDRNMLSSQLENAQVMIKALEESKQLVMNEMSQMSTEVAEYKKKSLDLEGELTALKLHFLEIQDKMIPDMAIPIEKVETQAAEKNCPDFRHDRIQLIVNNMQAEMKEKTNSSSKQDEHKFSHDLKQCSGAIEKSRKKTEHKLEEKDNEIEKHHQKMKGEIQYLKFENEKLHSELVRKDTVIFELKNEALKKDAVIEFLCAEKNNFQKAAATFESNYNDCIKRLNEAGEIYKEQYLEIQKLKKKLQKVKSNSKVDEKKVAASSPIVGMKTLKSLSEEQWNLLSKNEGMKVTMEDYYQKKKYSRSKTTGSISTCSSTQNQSSDSDTGEHVLRHHVEKKTANDCPFLFNESRSCADILKEIAPQRQEYSNVTAQKLHPEFLNRKFKDVFGQTLDVTYLNVASEDNEQCAGKSRESPELQSMIEQNLAKLSNSCSNQPSTSENENLQNVTDQNVSKPSSSSYTTEEQVMYTLPCPVCEGDIGIKGSSTEEMVKHLEVQHKQQMCPICGRLFDMTLPEKYFTFHIEDHFMKKRK